MMPNIDIEGLILLAKQAGDEILKVYQTDFEVAIKADQSPLTLADQQSNNVITAGLLKAYPNMPIITEENDIAPYSERKDWEYLWLVDPLDGTKEFIKKNGEFTVNIALIHKGTPIVGVVFVPVQNVTYYGVQGKGSFKINADSTEQQLPTNPMHYQQLNDIHIVASRSHITVDTESFILGLVENGKKVSTVAAGSSLKFCLVAEGTADVYPRFGPTMEWDTAAAHAVAMYAGRKVLDYGTNQPLQYNKEHLLNPWFIVE